MLRTRYTKYCLASSVALITCLVYLPALRNEFVNWDDGQYVFANFFIRSLDASFLRWAFLDFHVSNWHPLSWISHAIDYALWGLNPLGHHLTNIGLHAANTALVVLVVLKLMWSAKEGTPPNTSPLFMSDRAILIAAGTTGLLFGIHPVHVESVAWVAERKDLLCALFFLLSVMMYLKAVMRMGHGAEGTRLTPGAMLSVLCLFVLALMSKPMAVTLPVVLLILDWYPFNRIRSFQTFWTACIEKIPFFALSFLSGILTILAQKKGDAVTSLDVVPLHIRLLVAIKSLAAYLGKMLLPLNLNPFYPYPGDASLSSAKYLWALALVIVITTACALLARNQKLWMSAWAYYVVTLTPVLGIIQVGSQAMADRYTYLPSLGPFLVAGICLAWSTQKVNAVKRSTLSTALTVIIVLFLTVSLSYLTVEQIAVWRNSIALWTNVIEKGTDKAPLMYVNRGAAFEKIGMLDKAIADFERAVALDPAAYRAYISLGTAFETMGQLDKALENTEKAIALNPASFMAYRNRGILNEKMLRLDSAIADFSQAINLKPTYYEAYNNRGLIYAKTGQFDKAIADYIEAIAVNPRYFNAYLNRGIAFTLTGQYDRALEDFNRAIHLGQDDAVAYYNRGMFYRRTGNIEQALADVRKACGLGNEKACSAAQQLIQELVPR